MNPKTAERIRIVAAKVGYKANKVARSLAEGRTGHLALSGTRSVIVPYYKELSHLDTERVFWTSVEGITEAATASDHHIEVLGFNKAEDEFRRVRQAVEEERAAGVIDFGLQSATIDYLVANEIPMVSSVYRIGNSDPRRKARVSCDHIEGYTLGWRHLLDKGHSRIGYVGLLSPDGGSKAHRQECMAASQLLSRAPELGASVVIADIASPVNIWESFIATYGPREKGGWPTAVFCVNDHVANRVLAAMSAHGISVPRDLSVFGFGDFPSAELSTPGVTTIRIPRKEIAVAMFRIMEDIIAGKPGSRSMTQVLPMTLVERGSVADMTNPKIS